jgi:hypothetical protein
MKRIRCICSALGIEAKGRVELTPAMFLGRRCQVRTRVESFNGEDRAAVEFLGYEAAPEELEPSPF